MRELYVMAEERRRETWRHTSSLLAMLVNCHRDPKKTSAAKASDFDPFEQRSRCKVVAKSENKAGVDVLREAFFTERGKGNVRKQMR